MVDLLDMNPIWAKQKAEREARAAYQGQARHQAALDFQTVTASREWNVYLQHLQALLEADAQALEAIRGRLLGDAGLSDVERDSLTRRLKKLEGRIEARRDDMALPGTIMQDVDIVSQKGLDNA